MDGRTEGIGVSSGNLNGLECKQSRYAFLLI